MFIKKSSFNLKNSTVRYRIRLKYGVPIWFESLLIKGKRFKIFFSNTEQFNADPDLELQFSADPEILWEKII